MSRNRTAELLIKMMDELGPVLYRRFGSDQRLGRRLLGALVTALGAQGAAVCAWRFGGRVALSAVRGLEPQAARAFQVAVQRPPGFFLEAIWDLGWPLLARGEPLSSGWEGLDQLAARLTAQGWLALWPLSWTGGSALLLLSLPEDPAWPHGFGQAAAGYLDLCLDNLLLYQQAARRDEDYRRIFQNSRDMIYLTSRDGRWLDVNPAGVALLGYDSAEELLAVPDIAQAAYANPADRKAFQAAIEKDGFVKDYEVQFKKKDGTPIQVSITAQVRRRGSEVLGYEGIIKDITARKQAEEAAARERKLTAAILEVAPVAIFVVDRHHRVIHWNRACQELTGVPAQRILGTTDAWRVFQRPPGVTLADLVVEQDENRLWEVYQQEGLRCSVVAPGAWQAERHYDDLGGRSRDLFFTAAPLRDEQGELVGAVEAALDLSELRRLERRLAESERLYRTMVQANREGIALQGTEGLLSANPAFQEMFGLAEEELAGRELLELLDPGCRREFLTWIRGLEQEGAVSPVFEGRGLRRGESFHLELVAAPVALEGGRALLFSVRDVTQRRRMEEQLIQSERLAATGKLAFELAHEVNNPLSGIITYAYLLAEDLEQAGSVPANLEKIIKLANRCKIIVRGLLDFARDEGPGRESLDLNQVLRDALSLVEGHLVLRQVELVLDLAADLPRVYGQRIKLEQVFLNLVVNAAEAMEGKGRLEIASRAEGDEVVMSFRDWGAGMPPEVLARVFEPFFSTKERDKGVGLGLAIVHGIVKQHGGRLEVESEPGRGSCFRVRLPVAEYG